MFFRNDLIRALFSAERFQTQPKAAINHKLFYSLIASTLYGMSAPLAAQAESPEILYVFDASGSMNEMNEGKRRIDAAKEAVLESLSKLPAGTPAGFRAFAHRVDQANKEASCKDTELVAPVATGMSDLIKAAVTNLTPKGYTPLAHSLSLAGNDFPNAQGERQKSIILLSDGEETCGGDPVAEIKALKAKNIAVKVYAIGFDVDEKSRQQLKSIAQESGGEYFDAKNQEELRRALQAAADKSLVINKAGPTVYGQELRGGDTFETAFAIPPQLFEKELRLDHHQKVNQYDYFSIPLKAGQEVWVTFKTLEEGVYISADGKASRTKEAAVGGSLHAPSREKLNGTILSGNYREATVYGYALTDGNYFIRIGNDSYPLSKDGFTFEVTIRSRGDIDGPTDAGETSATALPITPGSYEKNFIAGPDTADWFIFSATAGEVYSVKIIPGENTELSLNAKVLNDMRQEIASGINRSGQGFKLENITIPETGQYILKIGGSFFGSSHSPYSISLTKSEGAK